MELKGWAILRREKDNNLTFHAMNIENGVLLRCYNLDTGEYLGDEKVDNKQVVLSLTDGYILVDGKKV
ncbi:MAG: hypothetical protein HYU67_04595 [Flavobacteriia bacterium]|nr:hypothetical protein [Flavobacteriia bacterium]